MATWRTEDAALGGQLLARLNKDRRVDSAGKATFEVSHFSLDLPWSILADLLILDERIPELERQRIVRDAVFAVAARAPLTAKNFLAGVSKLEGGYLDQPLTRYIVLGQVSIAEADDLHGARTAAAHISFPRTVPEVMAKAWSENAERLASYLHSPRPNGYRWFRVSTRERSLVAALDTALRDMRLLVGMWNLSLNYLAGSRISMSVRRPVNGILLSPIYTVCNPADLANAEGWYEPDYVGPVSALRLLTKSSTMNKWTDTWRRSLRRIPYRSSVETWIRSYNSALDDAMFDTSYLLLWKALEAMTCTTYDSHNVTVRRASALFYDREYHRALLSHLGEFRNRLVHAGDDMSASESKLYSLKGYVESVLLFHVMNGSDFATLSEAVEYLDLPSSSEELKRRLRLLQKAARMRAPKKDQASNP